MVKSGEVTWVQPKDRGNKPGPRSGHTINVVHEKAILFGGCGVLDGKPAVFNETYILHITDGFRWELVEPTGTVPPARWRHTATLLPDLDSLLVFGGLSKGKRYNDTHVFSLSKLEWSVREVSGTPPHPRSHHTANMVEFDEEEDGEAEKKIFIIGGYGGPGSCRDFTMDVWAIDLETWSWSKIDRIKGNPPRPRADHTVCVAGNLLILSGGRGAPTKSGSPYFDDVHVLDLNEQEWKRPPGYSTAAEGGSSWPPLPSSLWNHAAVAIESVPSYKLFIFGGQKAEFVFSDAVHVLDTGRMMWSSPPIAGAPPSPREDCGIAYDSKTCNLIFFGGWQQGWLSDLWCLNVAGVVGPPYAVQSVEPQTGPVTGNTPVSIYGIGFIDSPVVQVKFSDGKREATVGGKFVSPTQITCNTPSFEKYGPMDVVVRVAIKGDPFTVNKTTFSYYVNTKAARCMAYGPGVLSGGKAGVRHVMMMQAKDSTGKNRTSGNDAVHVEIVGPGKDAVESSIFDVGEGQYQIAYIPPVAGTYAVSVMLDENAFDSEDNYLHIRGSPFTVTCEEAWREVIASGSMPTARTTLRMWANKQGTAIYVVPEGENEDGDEKMPLGQAALEAEAEGEGEQGDEEGGEGSEEGSVAKAPATKALPPPPKPEQIHVLDLEAGTWKVVREVDEIWPDFDEERSDLESQLKRLGLPQPFIDSLLCPHLMLLGWAFDETVSGEMPSARKFYVLSVQREKLYVYGGMGREGDWFDDLYVLDTKRRTWQCVYQAETLSTLAAEGRRAVFCGDKVVACQGSPGAPVDVVQVLDIAALVADSEVFISSMTDDLNARAVKIESRITGVDAGMVAPSDNGDFESLRKVMSCLYEVKNHSAEIEYELDVLGEIGAYLSSIESAPAVGASLQRVTSMQEKWATAKKKYTILRKAIKPAMEVEAARVSDEAKEFEGKMEEYRESFLQQPALKFATGVEEAYANLDVMAVELREKEALARSGKEIAELFDFPEVCATVDEIVASCLTDLHLAKKLWDMTAAVSTTLEAFELTLWSQIDTSLMDEETKAFLKSVKSLEKRARDFDVYVGLETSLNNFIAALPCVADLKSQCMRPRHWDQLMQITGVRFELNSDMTLKDLLSLQLHQYVDGVGEVVDRAKKEDKMEQALEKLQLTWENVSFEFEQHRESDVYLLSMKDEDVESLEDNQLLVQGMMGSKYMSTFAEEVTQWQKQLNDVAETLSLLSEVQRKWAYLETLFIGSDEVKRELPDSSKRFVQVDESFKKVLKQLRAIGNAVQACAAAGLLEELENMSSSLQICEKDLAAFLESKRRAFPRFYFVSNSMLLDVLSYGNRPWIVAQHITAMFQGIKQLQMGGDPQMTVEALISNEGEVVELKSEGHLALEGKVESYLGALIEQICKELRSQTRFAIQDYAKRPRHEWLFDHVAQLTIVCTQIAWASETEAAFAKLAAGDIDSLRNYSKMQKSMLSDLISLVQGDLDRLQRRKVMNLITMETHSRDVTLDMIANDFETADSFKWAGQLKTAFESRSGDTEPDVYVDICDASFRYSFEYLGSASRLVITPLTDRIYITATQACHLKLGCALAGPAGTGKTETTKDLSASLGKAVYVFNCGPEMDYRTMGDVFKGLASSGSWGCFDEFNRLVPEVLSVCSVQYKAVLDAMRANADSFTDDGAEYRLHPHGCMSFITMNPGYLGRAELPESLKVLFRPVTVMVPDMPMIMENMLMAEGYQSASILSKKFFTLYRLLDDLLSKQLHYDWGLRAVKSVLVQAGRFKRGEPDKPESGLLMRALRDFNLPKIVADDMVVFTGLLRDLFPDVYDTMPRARDAAFEELVASVATQSALQPHEYFVQNVVDLQDLLDIRHCVFVMGKSGNNKSQAWKTLAKVWSAGDRGKTIYRDINPKSLTSNELYGFVNMTTREWKDGILSHTMRELARIPDELPKWIVLDGDLDANWIENMNSVMDDNRLLTLASNERIRLLSHMRLVFEIRDLDYASPATVTRAGILYISERSQWRNFVKSWVAKFGSNEPSEMAAEIKAARSQKLLDLFEKYLPPTLQEMSKSFKTLVPVTDFSIAQTLCAMLEGLLLPNLVGTRDASYFELYFVFAAVWACGSAMAVTGGVDYRKEFSKWWKDKFKTIKFPARGEVWDYYVDRRKQDLAAWVESVPLISFNSTTPMSVVTVPTGETMAVSYWLENLLERAHPAMLVGSAGCGKTAIIMGKLRSLPEHYMHSTINVNYFTNSSSLQRILESPLEKKAGKNYGPPGGKKLVYFVDDLNMAMLDKYNTASNISLMRQHMGYGHITDLAKMSPKVLLNTQYLAAMNPTAGSFTINPRLQRLFATFAINFPSTESLNTIYSTFLSGHLKAFSAEAAEAGKKVVQAALMLHKRVAATFRKTAINFQYEFNIRHLAGVFQGILMARPEQVSDSVKLAQLWLHESERVYHDRLASAADQKKYKDLALEQAKKYFKEMSPTTLMSEPLIFCHFANGVGDKTYDKVSSTSDLSLLLECALKDYNETHAVMDLVLFEDAMRHVARISRILESPGGHALLVGVGGSGKQSLTKLASYTAAYTVFHIVISATYGVADLKEDLKDMYRKCGLKAIGMTFLFTDSQVTDERFLVMINDLLASGSIPGLFAPEDQDDIINEIRSTAIRSGVADSREALWGYFIHQVQQNLHTVLCFSPIGDSIRVRARRFPALVNCVTIDWFQPWPEDALASVSKRFLSDIDLGSDMAKASIINFMPYSFAAVNKLSARYLEAERRHNYTTPKSFLELIALYRSMLTKRRGEISESVERYVSGVQKLKVTSEQVAALEESLKQKAVEVEQKKAKCEGMIPMLEAEKARASDEARHANAVATEAEKKQASVEAMKSSIEQDLAAAEPALAAAAAALDSLNKKDLGELKSLAKPPVGVEDVAAACAHLLSDGKGKVDVAWKASQVMMKDVNAFMSDLLGFKQKIDEGAVPKANFKAIRPLLAKEYFNVETMRNKSNAAAGLCDFVLNITKYWDVNEEVEPKRQAAAAAATQLAEAISAKDDALAKKEEAERVVAAQTEQYAAAVRDKEEAAAEAEVCASKLGLAKRLMAALGSEGARWEREIVNLRARLQLLPGDVLLASAFVSYSGCFSKRFRAELLQETFLPFLEGGMEVSKGGVAISAGADPLHLLTTEAERAAWASECLPADRVSMENGAIATHCARWPLMIDPQLQGITWVKKHEEARGVKVIRLGQPELMPTLEAAIAAGVPFILENLGVTYDAVLAPVVSRQLHRRGRSTFITLGDKDVDFNPAFKLYLQTKLSNPHYPPEIQAEMTLINFMVTEIGLEDQLLALTVSKERPDLEEQKAELISAQNVAKIKISELEEGILQQLANAQGDLLDNMPLIENLENSKSLVAEMAEKMVEAGKTEMQTNSSRELYRKVAARGALMFFLLSELCLVHSFHHYSLNAFITVFQSALTGQRHRLNWLGGTGNALLDQILPTRKKPMLSKVDVKKVIGGDCGEQLQTRLSSLLESITYRVFQFARRGLFASHKLILATRLVLRVLLKDQKVPEAEVRYLLTGGHVPHTAKEKQAVSTMSAQAAAYLTQSQWRACHALAEIHVSSNPFKSLPEDFEMSLEAWKQWLEGPMPEQGGTMPSEWESKLSAFQKLLLIRALRPDRISAAISAFVRATLGAKYVDEAPFDIKETFSDSSTPTPLLFILFPGVDPGADIEALGAQMGYTAANGKFHSISMGQGQEANAEQALARMAKEGGWVFLQNVHLMQRWLPTLERALEVAADGGHDEFRCFLSAEPPPMAHAQTIPEGILQSAIKIANEPPMDLKTNLRSAYSLFSQATLDASSTPATHSPMLFALAVFHALALGRRKFGTQGFSRAYPFNNGDLLVCASVLHNSLESKRQVPWEDLRYSFGEIMYGGHITDYWDRRITNTYLEVLLKPDLVDEKATKMRLVPGLPPLREGSFELYQAHIDTAVLPDSPSLFGLHPNSHLALLQAEAADLFRAVLVLSGDASDAAQAGRGGGGGGGGGTSGGGGVSGDVREAKAAAAMSELTSQAPPIFPIAEIRKRLKETTPYVVCMLQELERINMILAEMKRALAETELGLTGALNISDTIDCLILDLALNQVPAAWLKICGQTGPTGSYNRKTLSAWFADLLLRAKQLKALVDAGLHLPPSIWICGLFNPMGFVTACLQVTARSKSLPLDCMLVHTQVTNLDPSGVSAQPSEGTYVHGLFMEGARWDRNANTIAESLPKELHAPMPVMHVRGITAEEQPIEGVYECPVYSTTVRGPTFAFSALLPTTLPQSVWVLAAVALLMQPDQ